MSNVRRAAIAALVCALLAAGGVLWGNASISDPDLRYPIVLLTKLIGAIGVTVFIVRAALLIVKGKVLAVVPGSQEGLQNLGTILFLTVVSAMGCVFGVFLMRTKSGAIEYWPLIMVLMFVGLGAFCTRYLWREWQVYRRLSRMR
jgi:hypothetical protein